ncbi:hypothetical protein FRC08_016315 [Ceratobasidium sp. 394]|nr:hypothetical protein FRC08_016315 [Ceratobasidium sp. 394]
MEHSAGLVHATFYQFNSVNAGFDLTQKILECELVRDRRKRLRSRGSKTGASVEKIRCRLSKL